MRLASCLAFACLIPVLGCNVTETGNPAVPTRMRVGARETRCG